MALPLCSFLANVVLYFPETCQHAAAGPVALLSQRLIRCVSPTLSTVSSFGPESKKQLNLKRKNVTRTNTKLHEGKRWEE